MLHLILYVCRILHINFNKGSPMHPLTECLLTWLIAFVLALLLAAAPALLDDICAPAQLKETTTC